MVELDGNLRVHDAFRAGAVHVGSECAPLLVVDNFLSDPQVLIDYAANLGRFAPETETKYPRVRALLPEIYSLAVRAFLGVIIAEVFKLRASQAEGVRSCFSLVTACPEQLEPRQRILRFDHADERQLAVLHYLSPTARGGTGFYRLTANPFLRFAG